MRVYGKEEGLDPTAVGIIDNQERWYKYPLAFGDFVLDGGTYDASVSVPAHAICTGVKVVPTVQWTSATTSNLTVEDSTPNTLLTTYDVSATPGDSEFKASLVYNPLPDGSVTVSLDAEPTAGELDLWLMLSNPGND